MKRDVYNSFSAWKEKPRRKPLVLMGARQVGKTWLMRDFGKRNFARVHEFNFDDYYSPMGSVARCRELHTRKIPAQLMIYSNASHGLNHNVNVLGH